METEGSYLPDQSYAPEFLAVQRRYILEYLEQWRRKFRPDATPLLSMATALEEIAQSLRLEARDGQKER